MVPEILICARSHSWNVFLLNIKILLSPECPCFGFIINIPSRRHRLSLPLDMLTPACQSESAACHSLLRKESFLLAPSAGLAWLWLWLRDIFMWLVDSSHQVTGQLWALCLAGGFVLYAGKEIPTESIRALCFAAFTFPGRVTWSNQKLSIIEAGCWLPVTVIQPYKVRRKMLLVCLPATNVHKKCKG